MIKVAIVIISIMLFSGCVSIMRGTTDDLVVDTDPRGAECTTEAMRKDKIKAAYYCASTPCTYNVKKNTTPISRCKWENIEGEVKHKHAKNSSKEYYYLGNVLFGGIPGIIIDVVNQAPYDFESEVIKVTPEVVSDNTIHSMDDTNHIGLE